MLWIFLKKAFEIFIYKPCEHDFIVSDEYTETTRFLSTKLETFVRIYSCTKCKVQQVIRDGKITSKDDKTEMFYMVLLLCIISLLPLIIILLR